MKTTLDLDDALLRSAKVFAAMERSSLTRVIEDSLRSHLLRRGRAPVSTARLPPVKVYRGKGGMLPGIDPTSNRSMLDAADGFSGRLTKRNS